MNKRWMGGWTLAPAVLALAAAGCDGGGGPSGPEPKPGIGFVAGASVTDTALARPLQALIVEVRGDDGKPIPGLVVRFEGVPHKSSSVYNQELEAYVGRVEDNRILAFIADTTDAQGRVQALVQLGRIAGPARIAVTVPTLGMQDTFSIPVLRHGSCWDGADHAVPTNNAPPRRQRCTSSARTGPRPRAASCWTSAT